MRIYSHLLVGRKSRLVFRVILNNGNRERGGRKRKFPCSRCKVTCTVLEEQVIRHYSADFGVVGAFFYLVLHPGRSVGRGPRALQGGCFRASKPPSGVYVIPAVVRPGCVLFAASMESGEVELILSQGISWAFVRDRCCELW